VFVVDGERRHRGVEFTVFGEVTDQIRLLDGTSYIDAELTKTESGVNQGNKAPVFPFQFTLYGEWDFPLVKGATLTSRVTHVSSQYINFANTQRISNWTQWDLGARYRFERHARTGNLLRGRISRISSTQTAGSEVRTAVSFLEILGPSCSRPRLIFARLCAHLWKSEAHRCHASHYCGEQWVRLAHIRTDLWS
jgi:hypothetical protein